MHQCVKFRANRSNCCTYVTIFRFFKMAAVCHLGFDTRLFGSLTKSIWWYLSLWKCGLNRCSSFDYIRVFIFWALCLKMPIYYSFLGCFTVKMEEIGNLCSFIRLGMQWLWIVILWIKPRSNRFFGFVSEREQNLGSQKRKKTKKHARVTFHPFAGHPHWSDRFEFWHAKLYRRRVITHAKFCDNRFRGFRVLISPILPFFIGIAGRPYNSVYTTVLHCE